MKLLNYLFFSMFGSVLESCELTGVCLLLPCDDTVMQVNDMVVDASPRAVPSPGHQHQNGNVFISMKFSSLAALEIVKMITSRVASEWVMGISSKWQHCRHSEHPYYELRGLGGCLSWRRVSTMTSHLYGSDLRRNLKVGNLKVGIITLDQCTATIITEKPAIYGAVTTELPMHKTIFFRNWLIQIQRCRT